MKKNKNILKKVCLVILGFSMSAQLFSQDNSYIYMEDGNFYKGCEDYYMMGVNYGIMAIVAQNDSTYVSPTINQCSYTACDPSYFSCGDTPGEWKEEMIKHFHKMDSLKFNTIRITHLLEIAFEDYNTIIDTSMLYAPMYRIQDPNISYCYSTADTLELVEQVFERQGDLLQQVIDIIYEEGFNLKLLPLMGGHGVEVLSDTYTDYLAYMAERFKNEPVIVGYDLYNEPVWFAYDNSFNKYGASYICLDWYKAIKENAPSHLVTIGSKFYDLYKWDPEILPVDFISFHPYAVKYESEDWVYYAPFERYKARLKYMSRNFSVPYIIGESGYSGTDEFRTICTDPHPSIGNENEQEYFAIESLKHTKWYGHKGYTWWKYKDTPFYFCDTIKALGNYHGIVYLAQVIEDQWNDTSEIHKPSGDVFMAYNPSVPCTDCDDPDSITYANPTDTTQTTTLMYGSILDSTNNSIGIEDVFIWANITWIPDSIDENSFAITDSLGRFQIKTSYLLSDIHYIDLKYSKPGWSYKKTGYYSNDIPTDSVTYYLEPLNPDSIAQKPVYQSWAITTGMDTTWYNPQVPASNDIVVEDGATLTIKTSVYFNEGARLIVERGGTLIIDSNGKLTSNCSNELWEGVEVRGYPDSIQASPAQGFVEIINGGTVENAKFGVYAAKTNSLGQYVAGYEGGIIQCDSAYFINNKTAAYLLEYENFASASGFINTTFEVNDDYIGSSTPNSFFVDLYRMNSVHFTACTFINNSSIFNSIGGVYCYDSRVDFVGRCIEGDPCTDWQEGEFTNLKTGIRATFSTASTYYLDVEHTNFTNNYRGLVIYGSEACRVTSNTFELNRPFVTNGGCGLYLDNCTGYWVEDNLFKSSNDTIIGIGIVVNNSGGDANEIYRNSFDSLQQGVSAQEQNRNTIIPRGLQILCNDFDDCDADILVPKPKVKNAGVNNFQGVSGTHPEDMAGNLFQINTDPIGDYDDLNNEGSYFRYVYPSNPHNDYTRVRPLDYDSTKVGKVEKTVEPNDWVFDDGCPSQISSGGGGHKSTNAGNKELLAYYTGQVEELEATLTELIDGGNTTALNTEVELSTPPETIEIYNELMGEAPYVSEMVVGTAIEKENVLPNAMVRDVMVANPHSATSDELLEKLDERYNPMPNYMKAQVLQARNNISFKEELESKLSGLKLRQTRAFNGIVREYLSDTINPENSSDSLVSLYESFDDKNIKYRLAMLHLQRGEFQLGNSVLNEIPQEYSLNTEELVSYNTMVDYYNLLKGIKQDNRTELEATETEIEELFDIEETEAGITSTYARNILIALDEIDYLAPIQVPDLLKSKREHQEYLEILNSKPPSQLSVFPNPSKDFVIIEYHMEMEKDGIIEVKDVNGLLLNKIQIERLQDQVTVKTQNWKPGLYIASLKVDGKFIESCKFMLIK